MHSRSERKAPFRLNILYIVTEERFGRFGDRRTKFFLWVPYSQGNKKQGHQLRVSRVGGGVRDLRIEKI